MRDNIFKKVESKTNVSKDDIMNLVKSVQNQDLTNENNLRNLIKDVSKLAGKEISKDKENKIVNVVKNNNIPKDIEKFL